MNIRKLSKELQGVYDFTNVVDCQSVISMLLKDLQRQKDRAELLSSEMKVLAKMVSDNNPKAKKRAADIVKGIKSKSDVMGFLSRMTDNMTNAEKMTNKQLYDAGMEVWGDMPMDSTESCVIGEILKRCNE